MKFGKLLKEVSEAQHAKDGDAYLDYKGLKKMLKSMRDHQNETMKSSSLEPEAPRTIDGSECETESHPEEGTSGSGEPSTKRTKRQDVETLTKEEDEFVRTLDQEICRFNEFFLEKEEEYVIAVKHVEDRIDSLLEHEKGPSEATKTSLLGDAIQVHGGMVMMLNWSMLNYAALVKILKKHDKYTGLLLRSDFLSEMVRQPFFSTDLMRRLIQRSESLITRLSGKEGFRDELPTPVNFRASEDDADRLVQIKLALDTWKKLRPVPGTPERCSPNRFQDRD